MKLWKLWTHRFFKWQFARNSIVLLFRSRNCLLLFVFDDIIFVYHKFIEFFQPIVCIADSNCKQIWNDTNFELNVNFYMSHSQKVSLPSIRFIVSGSMSSMVFAAMIFAVPIKIIIRYSTKILSIIGDWRKRSLFHFVSILTASLFKIISEPSELRKARLPFAWFAEKKI